MKLVKKFICNEDICSAYYHRRSDGRREGQHGVHRGRQFAEVAIRRTCRWTSVKERAVPQTLRPPLSTP